MKYTKDGKLSMGVELLANVLIGVSIFLVSAGGIAAGCIIGRWAQQCGSGFLSVLSVAFPVVWIIAYILLMAHMFMQPTQWDGY